ncbi:Proline racemase [subsurface metagenome]
MSIRFANSIFVVDSHTAGNPVRIAIGGLPQIPGDSVAEKRDYVRSKMDYIRTLLCNEPRGHSGMFGAILTEPGSKDADFGVIFFNPNYYDEISGHCIIGIATVLIEMGMFHLEEPSTEITLETPIGLVQVKANTTGGKVKSVSFINVPSFLYQKDISVTVPGYGKLKGDVAFGGNWFLYIDAKEVGIRVRPENANELVEAGNAIKYAFNSEFDLVHPTDRNVSKKLHVVCVSDSPIKNKDANQNIAVLGGNWISREPSGTATSGRMAVLFARNKLSLNEDFINEGIMGETYCGRLIEKTKVGKYTAVVPEITGSAYITGFNHIVLDPDDPFGSKGFLLGQGI